MITRFEQYCALCGSPSTDKHHLINGSGLRQKADADGLIIPICRKCHQEIHASSVAMKLSKIAGQLAFEKDFVKLGGSEDDARKYFQVRYGRSYL